MGNQSSQFGPSQVPTQAVERTRPPGGGAEPLESFMKEKKRDEHLKNLGFKRSKSLRKSISKRLKRKSHRRGSEEPNLPAEPVDEPAFEVVDGAGVDRRAPERATVKPSAAPERIPSVERLDRHDFPDPGRRPKPIVGEVEPLPTHVQELEDRPSRRMDRLRRSLRSSLRRKKGDRDRHSPPLSSTTSNGGGGGGSATAGDGSKPDSWQQDEVAVRSGTCSFRVKYLGCVEVFESRGMQVCEEAVRVLKNSKRKSVRAILYVHGDGLRVVDEETKGLIVDQTIEKVSFCAPDRNFEKGFSYICRDGTTRRWMCHGFMAIRESGERLSHAVGCAFAICLEKKQERDKMCQVSMKYDKDEASFTRYGSFRQATLTERLQDPQGIKPSEEKPQPSEKVENPHAIARPHATDLMLQRQTSFRGFNQLQASSSPFKRNLSLRLNELPSTLERQRLAHSGLLSSSASDNSGLINGGSMVLASVPTSSSAMEGLKLDSFLEDVGEFDVAPLHPGAQDGSKDNVNLLKSQLNHLYQMSHNQKQDVNPFLEPKFATNFGPIDEEEGAEEEEEPVDAISSMCQQLSQELSSLAKNSDNRCASSHSEKLEPATEFHEPGSQESQSLPYISNGASPGESFPSSVPPKNMSSKPAQFSNPWDFVPDQPNKNGPSSINCDSSSGISSVSGHSNSFNTQNGQAMGGGSSAFFSSPTQDEWNSKTQTLEELGGKSEEFWGEADKSAILDDPFDAEWAALATRNNSRNTDPISTNPTTNPFRETTSDTNGVKAFELRM
eukprot:maker-scaffold334_size202906-snap-gene-1.39 protein:Tk08971 transcript:maker-scaffold334_size202906-snap-gene-1.39-mRNA-1 annotation:"protein numb"